MRRSQQDLAPPRTAPAPPGRPAEAICQRWTARRQEPPCPGPEILVMEDLQGVPFLLVPFLILLTVPFFKLKNLKK